MEVILLSFLLLIQIPIIFASGVLPLKGCNTYNIQFSSNYNHKLFYLNGELVSKDSFCKSLKSNHANDCFINTNLGSHCHEVDQSSGT